MADAHDPYGSRGYAYHPSGSNTSGPPTVGVSPYSTQKLQRAPLFVITSRDADHLSAVKPADYQESKRVRVETS